jgi:lipopolysaccharide transport system ATP-binding protein
VLTIRYRSGQPVRYASIIAFVYTHTEVGAFVLDSEATGGLPPVLPAEGILTCTTSPINLTPGRCVVTLRFKKGGADADYVSRAAEFDVESDDFFGTGKTIARDWALSLVHHEWSSSGDPAVR